MHVTFYQFQYKSESAALVLPHNLHIRNNRKAEFEIDSCNMRAHATCVTYKQKLHKFVTVNKYRTKLPHLTSVVPGPGLPTTQV